MHVFDIAAVVHTALKAVRGVRGEIKLAAAALDLDRIPEGGLNEDVGRLIADCGGVAAHDARDRFRTVFVTDHTVVGIKFHGFFV